MINQPTNNGVNFQLLNNNLEELPIGDFSKIVSGSVTLKIYTFNQSNSLNQANDYTIDLKDLINFIGSNIDLSSNTTIFNSPTSTYEVKGKLNLDNLTLKGNTLNYTDGTSIQTLYLPDLVYNNQDVNFTAETLVDKLTINTDHIKYIDSNDEVQELNLQSLGSGWVTKLEIDLINDRISAERTINVTQSDDISKLQVDMVNLQSTVSNITTSEPFHPDQDIYFTGDETKVDNLVVNNHRITYSNGSLDLNRLSDVVVTDDLTDINDNIETIQTDIVSIKLKNQDQDDTINSIQDDLASVISTGFKPTNHYDINDLTVGNLNLKNNTINYKDGNGQSRVFNLFNDVTQSNQISALKTDVGLLKVTSQQHTNRITLAEQTMVANNSVIHSVKSTLNRLNYDLDGYSVILSMVGDRVSDIRQDVDINSNVLGGLVLRVDGVINDVTALTTDNTQTKLEIQAIQAEINKLPNQVYARLIDHEGRLIIHDSAIQTLFNQDTDIQDRLNNLENIASSNDTLVRSIDDRVTILELNGGGGGGISATGVTTAEFQLVKNKLSAERTINLTQNDNIQLLKDVDTSIISQLTSTIGTVNKINLRLTNLETGGIDSSKFVQHSELSTLSIKVSAIESDLSLIDHTLQTVVNDNSIQSDDIRFLKTKISTIESLNGIFDPTSSVYFTNKVKVDDLLIGKSSISYIDTSVTTVKTIKVFDFNHVTGSGGVQSSIIKTIDTKVGNLTSEVSTLKLNVGSIDSSIQTITTKNTEQDSKLTSINQTLINIQSTIHTIQQTGFDETADRHLTGNIDIDILDVNVAHFRVVDTIPYTTANKSIKFTVSGFSTNGTHIVDLSKVGNLGFSATTIQTIQSSINGLNVKISGIETINTTQSTKITTLETDNTSNKSRLSALETNQIKQSVISTIKSSISTIQTVNLTQESSISTIKLDINHVKSSIDHLSFNWSDTKDYLIGDMTIRKNVKYICVKNNRNNPPENTGALITKADTVTTHYWQPLFDYNSGLSIRDLILPLASETAPYIIKGSDGSNLLKIFPTMNIKSLMVNIDVNSVGDYGYFPLMFDDSGNPIEILINQFSQVQLDILQRWIDDGYLVKNSGNTAIMINKSAGAKWEKLGKGFGLTGFGSSNVGTTTGGVVQEHTHFMAASESANETPSTTSKALYNRVWGYTAVVDANGVVTRHPDFVEKDTNKLASGADVPPALLGRWGQIIINGIPKPTSHEGSIAMTGGLDGFYVGLAKTGSEAWLGRSVEMFKSGGGKPASDTTYQLTNPNYGAGLNVVYAIPISTIGKEVLLSY